MRKTILIIALIIAGLCLVACEPQRYYFDYEELKNTVVKVELINYDNPDAKELFEKRDKVIPFDFSKMEIIETLKVEKLNDFLS